MERILVIAVTSLTNKEERIRSTVVRIGGHGRVIDTSVVEAVRGATLLSTIDDAAIVGSGRRSHDVYGYDYR